MTASCLEKISSSPVCFSVSHGNMKVNEMTEVEISLMNNAKKKLKEGSRKMMKHEQQTSRLEKVHFFSGGTTFLD